MSFKDRIKESNRKKTCKQIYIVSTVLWIWMLWNRRETHKNHTLKTITITMKGKQVHREASLLIQCFFPFCCAFSCNFYGDIQSLHTSIWNSLRLFFVQETSAKRSVTQLHIQSDPWVEACERNSLSFYDFFSCSNLFK